MEPPRTYLIDVYKMRVDSEWIKRFGESPDLYYRKNQQQKIDNASPEEWDQMEMNYSITKTFFSQLILDKGWMSSDELNAFGKVLQARNSKDSIIARESRLLANGIIWNCY